MKFVYTNNKKINEMIEEQRKFTVKAISFASLAIIFETCATLAAPDPILASCAIVNTLGTGFCTTKVLNLDKKIDEYKKTHKNS